jgi:hypothetical protein
MAEQHIDDVIEVKARTDGNYAVAYALLQLVEQHKVLANALDDIGLRRNTAGGDAPGALEMFAMELKRIADAMEAE